MAGKPKAGKTELLRVVEEGINREVGLRLRDARVMRNMRLEDLARATSTPPSSLSAMERGIVPIKVRELIILAETMGVPLAYFFEGLGKAVMRRPVTYADGMEEGAAMSAAGDVGAALCKIKDVNIRKSLRAVVLAVAAGLLKLETGE
jgi:transcriptional regulator with XRE-family HTH domain